MEIQEQKNRFYDKIYFLYSPKVNANSKLNYYCYCCCSCCFSFSIETIIILMLLSSLIPFASELIIKNETKTVHTIILQILDFLSCLLLFLSNKTKNIIYARSALFIKDFILIYNVLIIKIKNNEIY